MKTHSVLCEWSEEERKMGGILNQVHATVAASYGTLLCGLLYVWPSYTASHYMDTNTTLLSAPMTPFDISLIGSLPSLGAMIGTSLTGVTINMFGRHKGGLILMLPFLISWITIDLTMSSIVIMVARFVSGFSCGAFLVYSPIFISEIAEDSIRGFLASGPVYFYCLGALISYLFGWFLTYRYIIWANIVICCIGIAVIMMVTESPIWLLRQKREADARLAFAHYRGVSPGSKMVLEEISRLKAQLIPAVELTLVTDENNKTEESEKEKLKADEEVVEKLEKVSVFKMLFTSPSARRAFIATGSTLSLQVMMGIIVIQVYAKDIFSNAAPSLSPHLCSVMLACVLLFGSLTSAVLSDKFGRKILLIVSALVVVLSLIVMGVLIQTNILPAWVTAVLILLYCYVFMLGAGSIPYVLLAETFLPEVQSTAATILLEWTWLLNFILLGIFPFIVQHFGVHGAFYFFSFFGVLDGLVAMFFLPETKGMTNEQIQEAFLKKRKT